MTGVFVVGVAADADGALDATNEAHARHATTNGVRRRSTREVIAISSDLRADPEVQTLDA